MSAEVFSCARLLGPDQRWIAGGGLLVERGRVRRVLRSARELGRARRVAARAHDLGDAWVTPGLVDAHAHLELSGLAGALRRGTAFAAWVREVIARRDAASERELAHWVREGARRLLTSGTTTVGDIDTRGASVRTLARTPLRHVLFREVLDAQDPARADAAFDRVARRLPARARRREGLSPHAPFTVSPPLLARLGTLARRRGVPVCVHWSETEAEIAWLERGEGPLAALLGPSPRQSGLALLGAAGLVGPRLSLVHGNHPGRDEPSELARSGASVIHCPGCHAWFGRAPFPWARYRAAGVRVALGTDSLASNDELDMRLEMARFARAHPDARARQVWRMATVDAAAALGLGGEVGELAPGCAADFVAFEPGARGEAFEHLVLARPAVRAVWIAGRRALGART